MCGLSSLFIAVISSDPLFHFLSLELKSAVASLCLYLTFDYVPQSMRFEKFLLCRLKGLWIFWWNSAKQLCMWGREYHEKIWWQEKKHTFFWRPIQKITVFPTRPLVFFSKINKINKINRFLHLVLPVLVKAQICCMLYSSLKFYIVCQRKQEGYLKTLTGKRIIL